MVNLCVVTGCQSKHYPNCGIYFHSFPTLKSLREKWIRALNITGRLSKNSTVCSRHFKPGDYESYFSKPTLKENVVPSLSQTMGQRTGVLLESNTTRTLMEYNDVNCAANQSLTYIKEEECEIEDIVFIEPSESSDDDKITEDKDQMELRFAEICEREALKNLSEDHEEEMKLDLLSFTSDQSLLEDQPSDDSCLLCKGHVEKLEKAKELNKKRIRTIRKLQNKIRRLNLKVQSLQDMVPSKVCPGKVQFTDKGFDEGKYFAVQCVRGKVSTEVL